MTLINNEINLSASKVNYIDVILPKPLQRLFTYKINEAEVNFLQVGMRVAVPFGKNKIYTGIVYRFHNQEPKAYKVKEIHQILDDFPLVTTKQLKHWEWIANYYMCSLGEVMKVAIPSIFLLQSETKITSNPQFKDEKILSDNEFLLHEALLNHNMLTIDQVCDILSRKTVLPILNNMLDKKAIVIEEILYEKYTPKVVKYIRIAAAWEASSKLQELLEELQRAKRQKEIILHYFQTKATTNKPVQMRSFIKNNHLSTAALKALLDKGFMEKYELQEDRIAMNDVVSGLPQLNKQQSVALQRINTTLEDKDVCLLYGVTGSGKTEVYVHLIQDQLAKGNQVLYLVPEIALTTQLIMRLERFFGKKITVFHSRYSMNERLEAWQNILANKEKAQLIVGARSALFLPFQKLGLIIIDEEHETSYKQFSPAPRYHARDAAIVLAKQNEVKVLLGTATPSIETFKNVQDNKYGLVELKERYSSGLLPEILLINLSESYRKKRMQGHFSSQLILEITAALEAKEQIILFQNRRGYSPMVSCSSCGTSPQCPNCDVSLTYHKYSNELRCHYCSYTTALPLICPACHNPTLDTKGFGTEQLELEVKELFPTAKVGRMDFDTTRGKYSYHRIISAFQSQEIDILVGTQMLSKGLDFSNVSLVGVMNADTMLNFPDFRAHERSFQMLVQVSGRAGRTEKRGKVLIQTYNPYHQILQQVTTNDYHTMFKEQLVERWQYKYPPYHRLIKISLSHKDFQKVSEAAEWLGKSLHNYFGERVLGPSSPAIGRIRNRYIKELIIKIPPDKSLQNSKGQIQKIKNHFQSIATYRSIRFVIDVDSY